MRASTHRLYGIEDDSSQCTYQVEAGQEGNESRKKTKGKGAEAASGGQAMNTILAEMHEKGRSVYALMFPVECIKCHCMAYDVVNTRGETVCLHCGGEHDLR